mgnify:CR=1 FL=1
MKGKYSIKAIKSDFQRNYMLYIMVLPVLAYYIIFRYWPMYGIQLAFKKYSPALGIVGSKWIGLQNFNSFFNSVYCWRVIRNTLLISFESLIFAFPMAIIFALLLNELRMEKLKKAIQTVSYLPHFVSLVVICGMIRDFTASDGLINDIIALFGGKRSTLLLDQNAYRPIYIISKIWQEMGWSSIIYLAALTGIDPTLYDAAVVDGAGRFKRVLHVTLPGIMPTIVIMLILAIGGIMNVGYEKTILLYNASIYETSDIISSYVYRKGFLESNYGFSAAVGLFNSVVNALLVVMANSISRKVSGSSLW